jgi:import receptor subunit TOM20
MELANDHSNICANSSSNRIYDKTVPKPVLDVLAEMIAADSELNVGPFTGGSGSDSGIPSVGLD